MEPANHRNLSNHPIAGSLGSLYSLYGHRDPASCGGPGHLCSLSYFAGNPDRTGRDRPISGRSSDSLWDDQVGKVEKIWVGPGHAHSHVGHSDSRHHDYRNSHFGRPGGGWRAGLLYPAGHWPQRFGPDFDRGGVVSSPGSNLWLCHQAIAG